MKLNNFSKPILRIAIGVLFLYFGLQQLISPSEWIGFVPNFVLGFGLSANTLVIFNGVVELVLGVMLLIGVYTRVVALLLFINLLIIVFSIGMNPLGIRDLILAIVTFVVFLNGRDRFCFKKH